MIKTFRNVILFTCFSSLIFSCQKIEDTDKYRRPDWLAGKLYSQILEVDELSVFAKALELTGYDTIINVSGSYTIFAPDNEAFDRFFTNNPQYGNSVEAMPKNELERLVKFHIIQNPWSKVQLQTLNSGGWVTDDDHPISSKPWSFKRQTLLSDPNEKYFYKSNGDEFTIVDSLQSNSVRYVYNNTRKFAPIYFDDFFSLNNLNKNLDFGFYYDREYEAGQLYFADAKLGDEIFAENGFLYKVDKVIEPLKSAKELLENGIEGASYKRFLSLINEFPSFDFNREATFQQAEALAGGQFDSLFNLTYPGLVFNINNEEYRGGYGISTQRHYGLMVPDDNAFQQFLDEIVTNKSGYPHWQDFSIVPEEIKQLIVNAHMSQFPVFHTTINEGFFNGLDDKVVLDEGQIEHKYFGSNTTFLGLKEAIVPRAFSSVTGPVYLRPGFEVLMRAMESSRVLPAIKRANSDYSFFIISDNRMALDSSLMLNWIDRDRNLYNFRVFNRSEEMEVSVPRNDIIKRILNQVGIGQPDGLANKQFIENLAGNYIIYNQSDNTIQGSSGNVYGYLGDSTIVSNPVKLPEPTDNGSTYEVSTWFAFSKSTLFSLVSTNNTFYQLLIKAGMVNPQTFTFTFISNEDYYTVFLPTAAAINNSGLDTLNKEDLAQALKYHFVRDHLIFTDGKKTPGFYETARVDESSNEFVTNYSQIRLQPGIDKIDILNSDGSLYYSIEESGKTNKMGIFNTGDANDNSIWNFITTSVVHEVDTVILW